MADDGMLVNFEIGDNVFAPQVKFKGGNWRDRKRAKRALDPTRPEKTPRAGADGQGEASAELPRPAKRQRTTADGGSAPDNRSRPQRQPTAASSEAPHRPPQPRGQHVTSRLFTSNPTPVTNFEDQPPAPDASAEPTQPSNAPLSDEAATFAALGLSRRLATHLSSKLEMKAPTAIQHNTVPQLVKYDSDAFLQAETGSGKTLAYLLPIVQRIMALSESAATGGEGDADKSSRSKKVQIHRDSGLFAVVLAPTRELCKQIAAVLERLLRCAPWIVSTTVIGGESKKSEKARLRKGVNILIATPGRLTDHLDHTKVLDVGTVRWLVLDEGDRLMEMGFEDDLRTIVGKMRKEPLKKENKDGVVLDGALPARRVTVLCSATMKMNVQKLGEISLEDAVHITAARKDGVKEKEEETATEAVFSAPSQLKQSYIVAPSKVRLVTLIALLKSSFARRGSVMKAIIFISCADSVDFHFNLLRKPAGPKPDPKSASASTATPPTAETTEDPPEEKSSPVKTSPANNPEAKKRTPATSPLTESTVSPASYITSPANPTVVLHRLHGSLAQPVRTATLQSFATCREPAVLVTTDISSRGLDVPAVELVIEYDPAFCVADHVHRIGRTARAGRPGKAVLFLQPGCEEGYVSLLSSATPLTPQLYDSVLQAGFVSPIDMPPIGASDSAEGDDKQQQQAEKKKQSWTARAEALQLHLEQRLLASDPSATGSAGGGAKGKKQQPQQTTAKDATGSLLNAARQGFRSHIRAYATHVREERSFFDITQLHLGHAAKSFGLREAPTGIGGGVQRRTHRPSTGSGAKKGAAAGGGGGHGSDDEGGVDEEAAKRMRSKMKMLGHGASEFNIG